MKTTDVLADMTANVWQVRVTEGDEVAVGDVLVILEAMKMEINVEAPAAGRVVAIAVEPGQTVQEGDLIAQVQA